MYNDRLPSPYFCMLSTLQTHAHFFSMYMLGSSASGDLLCLQSTTTSTAFFHCALRYAQRPGPSVVGASSTSWCARLSCALSFSPIRFDISSTRPPPDPHLPRICEMYMGARVRCQPCLQSVMRPLIFHRISYARGNDCAQSHLSVVCGSLAGVVHPRLFSRD
ncbi:hypothetical protein HYPSUDRAFT_295431 [Hypholoma sublateritium FD-334 SS-4]|uniref:Uncharacterized protein n=1 Tax=Hypholoma sublateritium (strain FD-334 SS-4) TaxID=945553 RepID=A0A0D2P7I2_HYPSF|nr:hypothetical protein HYPSUDRAFT_295431 [Hypholoma sublateritium FD-334 SS-4]